ncbi:MAG: penicillin-binding protein 2 [bacterium]|nr:penicillin-binding protein 2 [bacterium]
MRFRTGHDPFRVAGSDRTQRIRRPVLPDDFSEAGPVGAGYLGASLPLGRIRIWIAIFTLVITLFGARAAYLQIVEGQRYRQLADGNRIRILTIPAQRGMLSDRFGQPLVSHTPNLRLQVVPVDLPKAPGDREFLVAELAQLTGVPPEELRRTLAGLDELSYEPVVMKENLSHDQAIALVLLSSRAPAVKLDVASRRQYLNENVQSLSHVLGYLGKIGPSETSEARARGYELSDSLGKAGLEQALEDVLRGRKGREQIEVDARGQRKEVINFEPPTAGSDIVLTIDAGAQQALEAALRRALGAHPPGQGVGIAMDPRNGEILALVSLPTFDNNWFARGILPSEFSSLADDSQRPLFNRAIQGAYPPGSTIKPVIAAAALQENVVTERTTVFSSGGIRVNQWFFPDWKAGGHGSTNLTSALAESVNTYFYYIGGGYDSFSGLGVTRLHDYLTRAGFGKPLNIELLGEASGLVPTPAWKEQAIGQPWYIGDTYHLSIGQGDLLATPIQVSAATAMIANGGTLYRPHLVRERKPADAPLGTRQQPVPLASGVFSAEHLAAVRRGLRQAVKTGSARALSASPLSVAGKTGTAQWSSTRPNHAWFTGYAPADDPQIVITILVEEGGEGSAAAVPVANEFLSWWSIERQ